MVSFLPVPIHCAIRGQGGKKRAQVSFLCFLGVCLLS